MFIEIKFNNGSSGTHTLFLNVAHGLTVDINVKINIKQNIVLKYIDVLADITINP